MKKVNMCIGRFQPFTNGHLRMVEDGFKKNGLPCIICMIQNKKVDSKHPFSDDLLKQEMEVLKKNYKFIYDTIYVSNADIVKAGEKIHDMGCEAQLWLCGDDRVEQYQRQAENPKYQQMGFYPSTFTVYTGTGRTEGVSGTVVRQSIIDNDINKFKQLMPKGTDKLFGEFKTAMDNMNEDLHVTLYDYIVEELTDEYQSYKKWNRERIIEGIKEIIPKDLFKSVSVKRLTKSNNVMKGPYYEVLINTNNPVSKHQKIEEKLDIFLNEYGAINIPTNHDEKYWKYEKHLMTF